MTGSPAGRVLALLERVQERPGLTAAELAAELGVGERTVRRYVTTLVELGIPVVAGRGRLGGYRVEAGYRMPPLMLTTDEAVALTLTLAVLGGAGPAADGPTERALAKLRRALPRAVAERVEDVLVAVAPPSRTGTLAPAAIRSPGVLATLAGAVVGGRVCRIRHGGAVGDGGAGTTREINPYGVVVVRGHLYVHGWCHLRRARRTFRVDRIAEATVLSDPFRIPAALDVRDAVERSLATSWEQWQVSVLLRGPIEEVRTWIPTYVALAEPVDEHTTRLRLSTRNLETTVLRLSDHPFELSVEEPAELAEAFAVRGAWMLRAAAGEGCQRGVPARGQ